MKNDYKKISDKIIKQFNISSVNDKGFVDDYVEYVGNNLISSGEWQDIDEDFDKFVSGIFYIIIYKTFVIYRRYVKLLDDLM